MKSTDLMHQMHMRVRRSFPSIPSLMAFEAVMRTGSATRAAEELNLTQSTVSRLLKGLEEQLGTPLFARQRKRLVPLELAEVYVVEVTRALDILQSASTSILANPAGGVLNLAVLPTFGTRWLAPRLTQFFEKNPGISVNLTTRFERFSFEREAFDAVIFFGAPDWPDAEHLQLFDERLTACAAPSLLARHPVRVAADMAKLPLLQLPTRLSAWDDWFLGQGAEPVPATGMLTDQFSMMIQAAISELGVALLPDYLAATEIAEKRLTPILTRAVPGRGAYWLAWPRGRSAHKPFTAFQLWIKEMAACSTQASLR